MADDLEQKVERLEKEVAELSAKVEADRAKLKQLTDRVNDLDESPPE